LDRRLGGPQNRSGRGGEEKNSQPSAGSNPRTPIVQTVAQGYTDKAITAVGGKDPNILNLGAEWRWVVSFALLPLYLREETNPIIHWIGGRVDPKVGLVEVEREIYIGLSSLQQIAF
jgi:hypothetical protein